MSYQIKKIEAKNHRKWQSYGQNSKIWHKNLDQIRIFDFYANFKSRNMQILIINIISNDDEKNKKKISKKSQKGEKLWPF